MPITFTTRILLIQRCLRIQTSSCTSHLQLVSSSFEDDLEYKQVHAYIICNSYQAHSHMTNKFILISFTIRIKLIWRWLRIQTSSCPSHLQLVSSSLEDDLEYKQVCAYLICNSHLAHSHMFQNTNKFILISFTIRIKLIRRWLRIQTSSCLSHSQLTSSSFTDV